jgi:hypothetical protein
MEQRNSFFYRDFTIVEEAFGKIQEIASTVVAIKQSMSHTSVLLKRK